MIHSLQGQLLGINNLIVHNLKGLLLQKVGFITFLVCGEREIVNLCLNGFVFQKWNWCITHMMIVNFINDRTVSITADQCTAIV